MAISTYENQTGWWAEVAVHGRQMLGRGHSQETALYDLGQKIEDLYLDLLDLRAEVSRKASEAMENGL